MCLSESNLTLKPSKCVFAHKELKYFGHVISTEGVAVDPEKTAAIRNFPVPRNVKGVRSFLGLAGCYRRFIKDFFTIAEPLTRLTKARTEFKWTDEQEMAFQQLKNKLIAAPILAYPKDDAPTAVHSDASAYGMEATLTQIQDG